MMSALKEDCYFQQFFFYEFVNIGNQIEFTLGKPSVSLCSVLQEQLEGGFIFHDE